MRTFRGSSHLVLVIVILILFACQWTGDASPFSRLSGLFKRKGREDTQHLVMESSPRPRWNWRRQRNEKKVHLNDEDLLKENPFEYNFEDSALLNTDLFKTTEETFVHDHHKEFLPNHGNEKRNSITQVFIIMEKRSPGKKGKGTKPADSVEVDEEDGEVMHRVSSSSPSVDWYMTQLAKAVSMVLAMGNQQSHRRKHRHNRGANALETAMLSGFSSAQDE